MNLDGSEDPEASWTAVIKNTHPDVVAFQKRLSMKRKKPEEPSSAESCSAEPSSAESCSAEPSSAESSSAEPSSAELRSEGPMTRSRRFPVSSLSIV